VSPSRAHAEFVSPLTLGRSSEHNILCAVAADVDEDDDDDDGDVCTCDVAVAVHYTTNNFCRTQRRYDVCSGPDLGESRGPHQYGPTAK